MMLLQNNSNGLENWVEIIKGHQVQIFKKYIFAILCPEKNILDLMGSQNQVKVPKGHQVQIFIKFIFELLCTWKAF